MSDKQASTDLAERQGANPLALVDEAYTTEEITAIASFVGVSEDSPAMRPFLGVAAHLGLSPILGEIWLIEGKKWNPETKQYEKFYRPSVGRDGFLKHAEEQPTFKGLRSRAVCANDTFEVEDDGWETKVLHRMASLRPGQAKGHESRWRGPVVGAWAKLYFSDGRPPLFYFAPAHEHVRTKVKDGKTELVGAWGYMSAMCEKAAQSYVLRLGFRITGVIPRDELREDDPGFGAVGTPPGTESSASLADDPLEAISTQIDALEEVDEGLRTQLLEALRAINDLSPFSWPSSKVDFRLGARTEDDVRKLLVEVEDEYKALHERQVEADARLAEEARAEEAIQVALARDVKPPIELHRGEGADDQEWVLVEDVIFDDDSGQMTYKLAGGGEMVFSPTDEIEVRTPTGEPPDEEEPATGDADDH